MLRFPNPVSDIGSFIRTYQELFDALCQRATFDLDDMSKALVERNLATSCGFMGQGALQRSTRQDRSRDPLYNQSKMYSELHKVLGWIHPSEDSALQFRFTYLGAHVAVARRDPTALFGESILGMVYPNSILNVRGDHALRPFATILRATRALDGLICRDEMIVGPLCLRDDRDEQAFSAMIDELRSVRGNWARLNQKLEDVSRKRGIKLTTMGNYTRFPLAVLTSMGWTEVRSQKDIYGKSIPFRILASEGQKALQMLDTHHDIRAVDLRDTDDATKAAVTRLGFYQMLDRAGFEIDPVQHQLSADQQQAASLLGDSDTPILFSPFQELPPAYVSGLFPDVAGSHETSDGILTIASEKIQPALLQSSSTVSVSTHGTAQERHADSDLTDLFENAFAEAQGDLNQTVELIAENCKGANQGEFYPFVARLFQALGYDCQHSRQGVHNPAHADQ